LFPLFATSVIDTGGKFAACVVDTCGKFPVLVPVLVVQIESSFEGHPSRGWAHKGGGHCHEWILALSSPEIRSRTTLSLTAAVV
jgi:hypothetical protein